VANIAILDMPVSVIIPALNERAHIRACIDAARRSYTPDEVEIIVADGGSTDGTLTLVPPDVTLLHAPRGRAVQMNAGAEASRGQILVFCHADSYLPAGWREAVIETLRPSGVSGGTFQTMIRPALGPALWLRNRLSFPAQWRIMFGDQVQFMRRATFERVGGFPDIPLMEDVEMSRALDRAGTLVRIPLRVETSSRRFAQRGVLRQALGNAWRMFRYLHLNVSPAALAAQYRDEREEERPWDDI
jgi:rSAM/selenodomain-associated transferase 2